MFRRNRSTRSGGIPLLDDPCRRSAAARGPARGRRSARSWSWCARAAGWRTCRPLMQVRALAHFDGREPCSYLLDPTVNYVPELPLGGEDPLGRHALCFTGRHPDSGRRFELVTLPDGCAFDLLGMSR